MFSYTEMKKPKAKRSGEPAIIKLSNDEPFNTLKAQVLKCISEALKLKKLAYDDYKVMFTVARHQTSSLSLKKQSEYDHMLESKIVVEALKKPDPLTVHMVHAYCYGTWIGLLNNGLNEPTEVEDRSLDRMSRVPPVILGSSSVCIYGSNGDSDVSQGTNSESDSNTRKKKKKKKTLLDIPLIHIEEGP
ncbi:uncharacterized protein F5147DRAFT_652898 [Suillus discolor]|uniref:Uncharacterized protein n=1 Tax=Suillus discolor TaxID=1912936 RepID=A0A9P7F840_9AGAM|nr:uncharacterized protein F5147DRAFT_652898 [Suillus discolor]KAG2108170.1 hypothetical protein F5147DRAFT_652898 [Suillus discolor]